jgi:hypothetical protein
MIIKPGVCVRLPDKRIGRVRDRHGNDNRAYSSKRSSDRSTIWRVRVKRTTSNTHQFLYFPANKLKVVDCPKGWMSIEGYNSYLKKTLAKFRERSCEKSHAKLFNR